MSEETDSEKKPLRMSAGISVSARGWTKTWVFALGLVLVCLSSWEGLWRHKGFVPLLNDDAGLWAATRGQVEDHNPYAVVLVGTSRMQLGIHVEAFRQTTGTQAVQLAMNAEVPIVVLRHFSQETAFRGVIVCDIKADWFYVEAVAGKAAEWIDGYRTQTWSAGPEQWLSQLIQHTLVFRLPDLSPANVWRAWQGAYWPHPSYTTLLADRSVQADYTQLEKKWREEPVRKAREVYQAAPLWSAEEFRERARKLDAMLAPLYERGGEVVFVRFPSSDALWELEDAGYPRGQYWDVFAAQTRAKTIHFRDYPTLFQFDCPDGSHLDYRDTQAFSTALGEVLAETLNARR